MDRETKKLLFIENAVKEQSLVAIGVKDADNFIRGIARKMNDSDLFIETEGRAIIQIPITDIIDVFAIESPPPNHTDIQGNSVGRSENEDELVSNLIDLMIAQYEQLNDDGQQRITSSLSKHFSEPFFVSKKELLTYGSNEIEMISNMISAEVFEKLNSLDLPQEVSFGRLDQ